MAFATWHSESQPASQWKMSGKEKRAEVTQRSTYKHTSIFSNHLNLQTKLWADGRGDWTWWSHVACVLLCGLFLTVGWSRCGGRGTQVLLPGRLGMPCVWMCARLQFILYYTRIIVVLQTSDIHRRIWGWFTLVIHFWMNSIQCVGYNGEVYVGHKGITRNLWRIRNNSKAKYKTLFVQTSITIASIHT